MSSIVQTYPPNTAVSSTSTCLQVNNGQQTQNLSPIKKTIFVNPYHKRDDDDSEGYSVNSEEEMGLEGSKSSSPSSNDEDVNGNKRRQSTRSRKSVNYNEDDDAFDIGELEEKKSKKKKLSNDDEDSDRNVYYDENEDGVCTCVRVCTLPQLLDKILKTMDSSYSFDMYAVQTLLLNCVMDTQNFHNEEMVFNFVKVGLHLRLTFILSRMLFQQMKNSEFKV